MTEYLVITEDKRLPEELKKFKCTVINKEQFVKQALSKDGVDTKDGVYYNIDSLDKDIYDALKERCEISITYYKFSDQEIKLSFPIKEDITIYTTLDPSIKIPTKPKIFEKQFEFVSDVDNTIDAANFIINIAKFKNVSLDDSFNSIEFLNLNNMEKIMAFSNALYIEENSILLFMDCIEGDAIPVVDSLLFMPPTDLKA